MAACTLVCTDAGANKVCVVLKAWTNAWGKSTVQHQKLRSHAMTAPSLCRKASTAATVQCVCINKKPAELATGRIEPTMQCKGALVEELVVPYTCTSYTADDGMRFQQNLLRPRNCLVFTRIKAGMSPNTLHDSSRCFTPVRRATMPFPLAAGACSLMPHSTHFPQVRAQKHHACQGVGASFP